ncbi:MAG: FAD-dependent oxidoreductase [Alphaproteobacteria bacterium]|nr:FAD-dependent oxidoreductase [Alphaproteobacteria bacterium]MBO6863225.1 FAD-dependent oxidoreductase [Alphaproteobacteria bacterium]MEC9265640.1 FAD-dependent oxidoreductase [Pseudomonadota bacterium]
MRPKIAVIGSGPSGFFLADTLSRRDDVDVDLFEKLTLPYGLVRYGVAPDHPGTKEVARVFDRVARRQNVRYFGGVEVGTAVTVDSLSRAYGTVVVATGADRGLFAAFPGSETRPDNVTAFDFMRAVNGHPEVAGLRLPRQVKSVAIIGAGNVAVDVARILCGGADRLEGAHPCPAFQRWFRNQCLESVAILCRAGPDAVRYSPAMYDELTAVSNAHPGPKPEQRFWTRPVAYDRGILFVKAAEDKSGFLAVDLIIHAVGQRPFAVPGLPGFAEDGGIRHRQGWVDGMGNVFAHGWAAGDMSAAIHDCRAAAKRAAPIILEHLCRRPGGHPGLDADQIATWTGCAPLRWGDWDRAGIQIEEG